MIPANLLARLQEADHALWDKYRSKEIIVSDKLVDQVQDAWLQHCLQDAIRAREWDVSQRTANGKIQALIRIMPGGYTLMECMHGGEGDTEAEALCRAYLAAIEAVKE